MGIREELNDLRSRIEKLEAEAFRALPPAPCEYERRTLNLGDDLWGVGAWCTRHGWNCPNPRVFS